MSRWQQPGSEGLLNCTSWSLSVWIRGFWALEHGNVLPLPSRFNDTRFSETSINLYETRRRHTPQDGSLRCTCHDNPARTQIDRKKVKFRGGSTEHETRFQASATMLTRSALFWGITQRRMVNICRRFGTTYRSHLQGSRSPMKQGALLDPWRWDRYVVPKRR
jgi:hypothetical protein